RQAGEELLLGDERLAGDDRDRHGAPHRGQQREIVGEARLLVPIDAEFDETLADADRVLRREAAMRLDQDLEIGAQGFPHRPHIIDREILVLAIDITAPRPGEWIELGGAEAHRLALASALYPLPDRRAPAPAIGV